MNTEEIFEGNRLIAEFMGGKYVQTDDESDWFYKFDAGNNPNPHCSLGTYKRLGDLDYHKRWDWLMPCLKNARQVIKQAGWGTPTEKEAKSRLSAALNEVCNINIENAHYCLVKFIEWFNKQPK